MKEYIKYISSIDYLASKFDNEICAVFETAQTAKVYKPKTIIALHPKVELKGYADRIELTQCVNSDLTSFYDEQNLTETQKNVFSKMTTSSGDVVRAYLKKNRSPDSEFRGLYGAFGFEFINQYYPIKRHSNSNDSKDFHLIDFESFIVFEHDKESAFIETNSAKNFERCKRFLENEQVDNIKFEVSSIEVSPSQYEFQNQVEHVRELCSKGEIYEAVIARQIEANFSGSPFTFFNHYKKINPSPYMFFINFSDKEYILGASPEMMIRVESESVEIRPISGTAKRGKTAFDDHENMLMLLNSEKEKSELDMLIDLARNDLNRVCKPGLEITDYRYVEKYSKVMHTVAHIKGILENDKTAFDALISCLNAGTLTGAPKIAAMNVIAELEQFSRGYYGGCVGYLAFNGNCDTAILIRSAHLKDGVLNYKSGATLLYDSDALAEFEESENKASAFLKSLGQEKEYEL